MPMREAVETAFPPRVSEISMDGIVQTLPESSILPGESRGLVYEMSGQRIIDAADLCIPGHSITAVMGPNGAGKSILVRLLHGLLTPTAGCVRWGGEPMSKAVRAHQAMVFQRPVLLRRSVRANLLFVLGSKGRRANEVADGWLERIGLLNRARQPARLLSGGEQQRLALARALVTEPQVLFLDEATASLDPAATITIETMIRDAHADGTTVVLVTHDISQARRLAHDVAFMHRGRIVEHTRAREFFAGPRSRAGADFVAGRLVI